jgi:hypothetical protein
VVWQRMLTFFGGADVYSVTIIVAAFMGWPRIRQPGRRAPR